MYRRPKFLSVLIRIREKMSREADYDVDLFTEMVRSGTPPQHGSVRNIRGFKKRGPKNEALVNGQPEIKPGRRKIS
jgi:hypothetical protein